MKFHPAAVYTVLALSTFGIASHACADLRDKKPAAEVLVKGYQLVAQIPMQVPDLNQLVPDVNIETTDVLGFDVVDGVFAPFHEVIQTWAEPDGDERGVAEKRYDAPAISVALDSRKYGQCAFVAYLPQPVRLLFTPKPKSMPSVGADGAIVRELAAIHTAEQATVSRDPELGQLQKNCVTMNVGAENPYFSYVECCDKDSTKSLTFGQLKKILGKTFKLVSPAN